MLVKYISETVTLFVAVFLLYFTDKFFLFKIDLHVYNRKSYDSDVFVWG